MKVDVTDRQEDTDTGKLKKPGSRFLESSVLVLVWKEQTSIIKLTQDVDENNPGSYLSQEEKNWKSTKKSKF